MNDAGFHDKFRLCKPKIRLISFICPICVLVLNLPNPRNLRNLRETKDNTKRSTGTHHRRLTFLVYRTFQHRAGDYLSARQVDHLAVFF
jgi:hypothetical protein